MHGLKPEQHDQAYLHTLFHKRSVAVVGNAASLFQKNLGGAIDGHDIVLRMNSGYIRDVKQQGAKFHVHVFSQIFTIPHWPVDQRPAHTVWMSPSMREHNPDPSQIFYPLPLWHALHQQLGARPSVGAMCVDMVTQMGAAHMGVFGFDFKKSPTFYDGNTNRSVHDFDREAEYIQALLKARGWRFY
ncbi:glycosyltransferase family 29 protein [Magnetococcus sp. PR-3]|uniref:glycosyltransferase family 29 protein n=1 Tax=Magnetococcus sp. PR-3 TaxID=3120355 RepID=UPI002FCE237C